MVFLSISPRFLFLKIILPGVIRLPPSAIIATSAIYLLIFRRVVIDYFLD
jgi:hypothetical protein